MMAKPSVAEREITIGELIDDRPLGGFQIMTIGLCGVVLTLDGFAAQSIGFLAPSMAQSLHIPVRNFGPVFASALFGLMISSLLAGPIADRVGRKGPIVAAALFFGAFTFATAFSSSLSQLIAFRFLTGLGLGAAIPNVVALVTEYSPKRLQQIVVTGLFCAMPFGALLGGLISTAVLPHWGWQWVFYIGGVLPIALALVLLAVLPESLRFLTLRGADSAHLKTIQRRLSRDGEALRLISPASQARQPLSGFPILHLFTEGRAAGTVLLWIPFFLNLLLLYFVVNWVPAVLRGAHMPIVAGILAVSLFSLGGMAGSIFQGYTMRRLGDRSVLLAEFLVCAVLVFSLAYITSFPTMMIVMFLAGYAVQGAQAGVNAIAATFYPTAIRSTGVGWALGIGRLGSILGPILGGLMVARSWTLHSIFLAGSVPALIAAAAIAASLTLRGRQDPYRNQSVQP